MASPADNSKPGMGHAADRSGPGRSSPAGASAPRPARARPAATDSFLVDRNRDAVRFGVDLDRWSATTGAAAKYQPAPAADAAEPELDSPAAGGAVITRGWLGVAPSSILMACYITAMALVFVISSGVLFSPATEPSSATPGAGGATSSHP